MPRLYTVQLTRAELEAVTIALCNCNGSTEDLEAVYGSRRLIRAADSAAVKLRHLEHGAAAKELN